MNYVDLETTGVLRILVYMLDHPEGIRRVDIRTELDVSSSSQIKARELLLNNGLIIGSSSGKGELLHLTETGIKIAQHLKQIQEILKNEIPTEKFNIIRLNDKFYIIQSDGTKTEIKNIDELKFP